MVPHISVAGVSRLFEHACRWLFLVTLIFAPWAYGSTTAWGINAVNFLLGVVLTLWIINLALSRRRPDVPASLAVVAGSILVIGWCAVLNANAIYDSDFHVFTPLAHSWRFLPRSVDKVISGAWMVRATMLLGIACFVADLSHRPQWVIRFWYTIGIAGTSIAFLGLIQKATGATMIFWGRSDAVVNTFFATFYYHANAGAFLNLVFPLIIGLAVRATYKQGEPWQRAIWFSAVLITFGAIFANTSLISQVLGVLVLLGIAIGPARGTLHAVMKGKRISHVLGLIIAAGAVYAIAQASHLDQPLKRWMSASERIPQDARWLATKTAIQAVPDAGWCGFGPGTFRVIFPRYEQATEGKLQGIWRFLHDDYLQTLLEWGWIGSGLWLSFFLGGALNAIRVRRCSNVENWTPRMRLLLPLVFLALGSVALHAFVDFPLQILSIQLLVVAYIGVCWASPRGETAGGPRPLTTANSAMS